MDELHLFGKLKQVNATVYFETENHITHDFMIEDILEFCLVFENKSVIIKGDGSGNEVILEFDKVLNDIDMQQQGYIHYMPVSNALNLQDLLGKPLTDLKFIKVEELNIGVIFYFSHQQLVLLNWGDELKAMTEIPKFLFEEYKAMNFSSIFHN